MSIPANIDHHAILADLNTWGWSDYKIGMSCGFSDGYVAQLKCDNIKEMGYQKASRLFNFWESEKDLHTQSKSTQ